MLYSLSQISKAWEREKAMDSKKIAATLSTDPGTGDLIRKPKKSWLERLPWLLLGIGLAIVGGTGSPQGRLAVAWFQFLDSATTLEVLKELGIALAIIGFVTLSIERARVNRFSTHLSDLVNEKLDQIKASTVDAIVQGPLPREYYEHISRSMIFNRFLRYDWEVRLEFKWHESLDPNHEFLEFSFEQEYRIRNLNSVATDYKVDHFESLDWDDKFPDTTRIHYVRAQFEHSNELVVDAKPETGKRLGVIQGDLLKFQESVPLIAGGVLFVQEASTKMMRERSSETLLIGEPTLGLKCWIKCPEELVVQVELPEVQEQNPFDLKLGEETRGDTTNSYWHIQRPLPPASYLTITWRKATPAERVSPQA